jgi:hypothetical protein
MWDPQTIFKMFLQELKKTVENVQFLDTKATFTYKHFFRNNKKRRVHAVA